MRSIVFRYGLIMASGFIVYFIIMHLLNLSHFYRYRIFNALIQLTCIALVLLAYKNLRPNEFGQFTGVSLGVITSIVGVSLFAMFQFLFLALNPDFMAELKQIIPSISYDLKSNLSTTTEATDSSSEFLTKVANFLTPLSSAFIVLLEGLIAGLVLSYLVMRVLLHRK